MKSTEFYRECGFEDVGYMPPKLTSESEYPYYIETEVKEKAVEIQKYQNENTITFAFMTDIHYASNHNHVVRFKRTMNAYRELAKIVSIDKLILGGDYTNEGCKEYKENTFRELRGLIGQHDYFPVHGNHDDGTIWDRAYIKNDKAVNHLTHTDLYKLFYNHLPKCGAEFDPKNHSLYYMCNDNNTKTRYIFLDSGDVPYIHLENGLLKYRGQDIFGLSQAQTDWLANTALKFEKPGWSVLFVTHSLIIPTNMENPGILHENMELFRRMIIAYEKGEDYCDTLGKDELKVCADYKFSKYERADIIGCFVGDYHYDEIYYYDDKIPVILTGNAVMYDKDPHAEKRTDGTKTEILFDVVTVDKKERKIHITRIGAGNNRETQY